MRLKQKYIVGLGLLCLVLCIIYIQADKSYFLKRVVVVDNSFTGGKSKLEVRCYVFQKSDALEEKYTSYREHLLEEIEILEKECAEIYKDDKDCHDFPDLLKGILKHTFSPWENWPYVSMVRLLQRDAKPTKLLGICRYEKKNVDIGFLVFSPDEIYEEDIGMAVKRVAGEIEKIESRRWKKLCANLKPLLDENGDYLHEDFLRFMDSVVFLEQR